MLEKLGYSRSQFDPAPAGLIVFGCGDMRLSAQQFERTRRLALDLAGIELAERHRELLHNRSRRMGLDSAGFDALLSAVESGNRHATEQLLCLLTTNFTGFFRHPSHFHIAAEHAVDVARLHRRARLWSAAAATGEEPYSLAIAIVEAFRSEQPPVEILATDIDVNALSVARQAEYTDISLRGLAPARRERFLTAGDDPRKWTIVPAVRRLIEFRTLNLAGEDWPEGIFEVILCRNVLMYLEERRRCTVAERMASLLAPDGLLILDPAEHLGKAGHLFEGGENGIYSRVVVSRPPSQQEG